MNLFLIQKDGQTYYKTKGDNNNSVDPELVNYSQVKGILVFKISKLGTVITKMVVLCLQNQVHGVVELV